MGDMLLNLKRLFINIDCCTDAGLFLAIKEKSKRKMKIYFQQIFRKYKSELTR